MIIHGGNDGDLNLYGDGNGLYVTDHVALEQIEHMYKQIDRNKDGKIDEREVDMHITNSGYIPHWASEARFPYEMADFLLLEELNAESGNLIEEFKTFYASKYGPKDERVFRWTSE